MCASFRKGQNGVSWLDRSPVGSGYVNRLGHRWASSRQCVFRVKCGPLCEEPAMPLHRCSLQEHSPRRPGMGRASPLACSVRRELRHLRSAGGTKTVMLPRYSWYTPLRFLPEAYPALDDVAYGIPIADSEQATPREEDYDRRCSRYADCSNERGAKRPVKEDDEH